MNHKPQPPWSVERTDFKIDTDPEEAHFSRTAEARDRAEKWCNDNCKCRFEVFAYHGTASVRMVGDFECRNEAFRFKLSHESTS